MQQVSYALEWLDTLIMVSLNPESTDVCAVTTEQVRQILQYLPDEKNKIRLYMSNQIFGITREKQIVLLVSQYHSALIQLLDQAYKNQKHRHRCVKYMLKEMHQSIISTVDELLSFIEVRFSAYLSLSERVPLTYLAVTRKEIRPRVIGLQQKLATRATSRLTTIVFDVLHSFIDRSCSDHAITFKDLLYIKELLKELEVLEEPTDNKHIDSVLNELLVYLNFNSKAYLNYFTQSIATRINTYNQPAEKMDQLLFAFKELNQLHKKTGVVLDPHQPDLKNALNNWFAQEIFYLEKKLHLTVVPLTVKQDERSLAKPVKLTKVLCILSVDQMALILRAADDLKILLAKSLNAVFKSIVPYLSTPYQENLSADSMRSKSYAAEERDKEIAIETLEQMIKRIKDY